MKTPNPDLDPFLAALQADLPSAEAEARVRARLLAAGLALTGAAVTSGSSAATSLGGSVTSLGTATSSGAVGLGAATPGVDGAAAGTIAAGGSIAAGASTSVIAGSGMAAANIGAGTAPAALIKLGLFSKLLLLPAAAKVGVASTLVVVAAATSVPLMLEARHPSAAASQSRAAALPHDPTPTRPAPSGAPTRLAAATDRATSAAATDRATSAPGAPTLVPPSSGTPAPTALPRRTDSIPPPHAPAAAPKRKASSRVRTSTLSEETRLMESAMLALQEADRELAERTLAEHARRFPNGLLERERARALARLRQLQTDE